MRPADTGELMEILDALRQGRSLSDRFKWPWHVSRIEGTLLPAYASDVVEALGRLERPLTRPATPCSSALWKCLYTVLRGLYASGADVHGLRAAADRLLYVLRSSKSGDIFNRDGRNLFLEENVAERHMQRIREAVTLGAVRDALRWNAVLLSWTEACAFTEHTNHHESHGDYRLPDGSCWYIHSHHSLNRSLAVQLSGIHIPLESAEILVRWGGTGQYLEVFNNRLDAVTGTPGYPIEAFLRLSPETSEPARLLGEVTQRMARMVAWVEDQPFAVQAAIFVDGYRRRLQAVLGDAAVALLSGYQPQGRRGCSFAEVEEYILREISK